MPAMTLNLRQKGQELKVATPGFSPGLVSGNHSSQEVEDGAIYSAHWTSDLKTSPGCFWGSALPPGLFHKRRKYPQQEPDLWPWFLAYKSFWLRRNKSKIHYCHRVLRDTVAAPCLGAILLQMERPMRDIFLHSGLAQGFPWCEWWG